MKSLEQDALKAQMVIAKSKEGKKRSTLEQLAESPSPAPTPSPTPLEGTGGLLLLPQGAQALLLGLSPLTSRAGGSNSLLQAGWEVSGGMWHLSAQGEGSAAGDVMAPGAEVRAQGTQPASWFSEKAGKRCLLGGQKAGPAPSLVSPP